jgi:tRNA G18 (ribose-2'-O)-methylase SpoU
MIIRVEDPGDPRIAPYRNVRERDLVGRQGRFVAEGKVVLKVLLSSPRFVAESVLVLENRLAGLEDLLRHAPDDVPVYAASADVMDAVAGFHVHRGILAIGKRRQAEEPNALLAHLPKRALVVGLVGIANHDNMGSIFRNAAAFEADAVLFDRTTCDPLYRKAIRVSVGAALKVPFAQAAGADDLVACLVKHGFGVLALSPRGAFDIAGIERPERVALLLGTEGEGLPQTLMTRLTTVRITMSRAFDSLNVAAASAIALHCLSRQEFG